MSKLTVQGFEDKQNIMDSFQGIQLLDNFTEFLLYIHPLTAHRGVGDYRP